MIKQNITCTEIEALVARHWNFRENIIVPNVSWGLNIHECDLLIVSKANWATEVEIKVSKADLKKDLDKKHQHKSNLIKYLYFAIPEKLETCIDLIPEHAGIIIIRQNTETSIFGNYNRTYNYVDIIREPKRNEEAIKLSATQVLKLSRLGCMRIWSLKRSVISLIADNKCLRSVAEKKERIELINEMKA